MTSSQYSVPQIDYGYIDMTGDERSFLLQLQQLL